MRKISYSLTVLGIILAVTAIVGRFIDTSTVSFGGLSISISASAGLVVANTVLLLSILAVLYAKK
ncbi:MAG: hypothetical protein KBB01_04510 [Candidatus Omnitrophica bacterium]|jgi:hypothetical protein|nr:hypothetical protein [Candidatus Omnitrophota bacterium]